MRIFPNTPDGISRWLRAKGRADLRGYDTSRQAGLMERWGHVKRKRSMSEEQASDLYDVVGHFDSRLSGLENRAERRRREKEHIMF